MKIVITNAPRPKPTISKSIAYLRKVGFEQDITVFSEPDSPLISLEGVTQQFNKSRLGCFKNFSRALQESLYDGWIFILQDDARYNRYIQKYLNEFMNLENEAAYLTPYLSTHDALLMDKLPQGFHIHDKGYEECYWGATISLLIHSKQAKKLLSHPDWKAYDKEQKVDCLLCHVMKDLNLDQYFYYPSLVDHFGHHSTLGHRSIPGHKGYKFFE